jgi:hypothetical protein
LLYLRPPGSAKDTTLVSFYRTQYSPAGPGHAALVLSDAGADGRGSAPLRVIVTDNPEMAAWARQNLARSSGHPFRDPSLPIVSGDFLGSGVVGRERVETIRTERHEIVLRWADFEPPLYFEGPQGTLGADYDVFSLLFPATTASVTLDGEAARG